MDGPIGVPFLSTKPIVPIHGVGGNATTFKRTVSTAVTPSMPDMGVGAKAKAPGARTVVTPLALSITSTEATQLAPVAGPVHTCHRWEQLHSLVRGYEKAPVDGQGYRLAGLERWCGLVGADGDAIAVLKAELHRA